MPEFVTLILRGTRASQPAATTLDPATLYFVTDESVTERVSDDSTTWESYSSTGAGNVSSGGSSTDNAIVTWNGTGGDSVDELTGTGFVRLSSTVPSVSKLKRVVGVVIGDGTNVISTGVAGYVSCPVAGTITKVRLLSADASVTSGSIVVDVWKDTYANYPPTDADSITASAPPTISTATKSEDATLTGWTTSVSAGDVFGFNVDSVTSLKRVVLELEVQE